MALIGSLLINVTIANPVFEERYLDPPTVILHSPINQTYTSSVFLNFTIKPPGTWQGQELISAYYYVDGKYYWVPGSDYNDLSPPFNYCVSLSNISEGIHSIEVFAQASGLVINRISGSFDRPRLESVSSGVIYFIVAAEPLKISLFHPAKVYDKSEVPLNYTVNKPFSKISYILDGQANVSIAGNTTLTGLSNGLHNVTVYAWDLAGNVGASETVFFSIQLPEPFPIVTVATASIISVIIPCIGVIVYLKKRKNFVRSDISCQAQK